MDLSTAIIPKSDQLNADDLIAGPRTIRITRVEVKTGEQPVSVFFEGDNGKPWKPCKSMLRALVHVWGVNSAAYVGRALTIALDPSVIWAGKPVGGIRITHMSGIQGESVTFALTDKKGSRKPYTIKRLDAFEAELAILSSAKSLDELKAAWTAISKDAKAFLKPDLDRLKLAFESATKAPANDSEPK